jgi:hypothetical protein
MAKRGKLGIEERHTGACVTGLGKKPKQPTGKRCNCAVKYRASKKDPTKACGGFWIGLVDHD